MEAALEQRFAALEAELRTSRAREEELRQQVTLLTQQQAQNAQARQAPDGHAEPERRQGAFAPIVDTRMLAKPRSFDGRDENWPSWAVVIRAYCGALDRRLLSEMEMAENMDGPIDHSLMTDDQAHRSSTLWYILIMLVEGAAQTKAENCISGQGMEFWRRLVKEYEPKTGSRSASLLVRILTFDFGSEGQIQDHLETWESLIKQYDGTVSQEEKIRSNVKVATVISRLPKCALRDHLLIHASRFENYDALRREVNEILKTQRDLEHSARRGGGQAPMELGALGKAGREGKGDAKKANVLCWKCNQRGHYSRECPTSGGGKGGGGKPKGKGKGKGKGKSGGQDLVCHRCGRPGHKKTECYSKKHKDGRDLNTVKNGKDQQQQQSTQKQQTSLDTVSRTTQISSLVSLNAIQVENGEKKVVHSMERVVRIGVDSGAGVTVWPVEVCDDWPTVQTDASRKGVEYSTAGAGATALKNEGERTLELMMADGDKRRLRAQVAGVRKPLLAVSEMNDAGHDVHFLRDGRAFAVHGTTGKITNFIRTNGVFELEVTVPRCPGGPGQPQV